MCGLAGIARIGAPELTAPSDSVLRRMLTAVAHRGPDESVLFQKGPVGLGFARLSLVDLVGGGQPLQTEDGSLVLIANGEIYNHKDLAAGLARGTRLRTRSDCEVLLHLYRRDGESFLDRVRGMFALVLWDRDRGRLVFARDRFGIKPLFYHRNAERVVFGSEIKALFEDEATPRSVDWERALADPLMSGSTALECEPTHAWFHEIELVPAATIVTFDLATGGSAEHEYWKFPHYDGDFAGSEADLVKTYGEALQRSVSESETADVEVGLFLSGGIDSAAVAALAVSKPQTFTALNASTLINGDAEHGHRVASLLGLANHQVLIDADHVPTAHEWKNHLWLLETPLAGPESYYKREIYRYVAKYQPQIKGMLLGAGSDEFNGGYTAPIAQGGDWQYFLDNIVDMAVQAQLRSRPELAGWWNQSGPALLAADRLEPPGTEGIHSKAYSGHFRMKYRDVQLYNCWHEDRTAAGSGIEARVPFLDHRLVEIAAAVPERLRPSLIWDKQILRRALEGALPAELRFRPKVPFFYGDGVAYTYRMFARMLAKHDNALIEEALQSPGARTYLDATGIRATTADLNARPGAGNVEFLLNVVNLALLEQMADELPKPPASTTCPAVSPGLRIADWDAQAPEIEARVLRRPEPDSTWTVALCESAQLLQDVRSPADYALSIAGTLEYVIDATEHGEWLDVLRRLDGERPLVAILDDAGVPIDAVWDLIVDSLRDGVLVLVDGGKDENDTH